MSQSLDRALTLLDGLAEGPRTLDQLAEVIGVHKSTVLRLLRTLESHRFVQRDGVRYYRLGTALFDLAHRSLEDRDVRRSVEAALRDLNAQTGHTVHLASYEDGEVVYIDKFESRHQVRMYSRIGKRAALHCTAVAKILVAALPDERRREIAKGITYEKKTENTIITPEAYLTELATVAARGYAVDNSEHEDFIHCIAAPIRGARGEVLAAMSLSVPKVLLDLDGLLGLVPDLLRAAEKASVECGYHR
ncbi:IclR family transcriptional regulator [Kibdelosporangium phytohabitans]|uniref:IclR family transcriptional regulator n=1 Tax=Kibdelosporangium phytohabitans TaxID=860235 RepID=A0A0N9I1H3_9PSEU|nr:IclR family transcriptional regulator [Kibdelosporangium phytohabitans]ALG12321.1 IclR family transcriptional regulator [Kibdelosporangium phytohabitans]MBE1463880.1 DNA-binding IclR family transcriptional regulator [Kibdelosporangium phytohabitans]